MPAIISLSAMDKLMRKAGAARVSDSAKEALAEVLEEIGARIARKADTFARHAGRKTTKKEDIELAAKETY